jgi:hypothetical protein
MGGFVEEFTEQWFSIGTGFVLFDDTARSGSEQFQLPSKCK